jgi:hypothetical protein
MPSISACPQCQRNILIHSVASPSQRLRCPHCQQDFALQAVLSNCVELPPIAEPVDEFASEPPWSNAAVTTDTSAAAAATTVPESAPVEKTPEPMVAAAAMEKPVAPTIDEVAPPELIATITHDCPVDGISADGIEAPQGEVKGEVAGVGEPQEEETQPAESEAASEDEYVPGDEAEESAGANADAFSVQRGARRRRQSVGWFGQLVALALGGVMGLGIGYYALLWIGGRDKDFLNLADKLPSWAVPKKVRRYEAYPYRPGASGRNLGDLLNTPDAIPPMATGLDNTAGVANPSGFTGKRMDLADDFHPGPRNFIPYSAAQLSQAVADVENLLGCDHCGSTGFIMRMVSAKKDLPSRHSDAKNAKTERKIPCEECHGKPNGRITPEVYEKLCKLAETVCFAKVADDDPNLPGLRQSVLSVVTKAGSDSNKTQVIGRLAGYLMENGHREQNGIVLAGTLQEVVREGELFRMRIVLFGVPKTVTVLSHLAPNPPLKSQDRVMILGSIVDDPMNNVVGYTGPLPQIIWGGLPMRLQNDLP